MCRQRARAAALLSSTVLGLTSAGCGGGDSEVATVATAAAVAPTATQAAATTIEGRLARAGYRVVHGARPAEIQGAEKRLTVPVGRMVVYVLEFGSIDAGTRYGRTVALTARDAPRTVVARRVGPRVYVGVVGEGDGATPVRPLLDLIAAAEVGKVEPVRLGPR